MGQYGRIGKRRTGSATWQWMMLGFFPGILCGGMMIFGLFASGALNSLTPVLPSPTPAATQQVQVVTVLAEPTNAPATATTGLTATATLIGTAAEAIIPSPTKMVLLTTPTGKVVDFSLNSTPARPDSQSLEETTIAGLNPPPTFGAAVASVTGAGSTSPALQTGLSNLIVIPGGTFTMGTTVQEVLQAVSECVDRDAGTCEEALGADSNPQFQVQLAAFQLEETEVTFNQYVIFLNYIRSQGKNHKDACPSPNGASNLCIQTTNENLVDAVVTFDSINYNVSPGLLQHPAYGVTWAGAQAYCEAIGRRLPTEAEWEYAAKGGDANRIYPWGNVWNEANAKTSRPSDASKGTVAVNSYPSGSTPNGLKDMAGNVEEWVSDWYGEGYYSELNNQPQPAVNPQGPIQGIEKVLRGGSWDHVPFFARTVHRRAGQPAPDGNSNSFPRSIGFRCAAAVGENMPVANGTVNPANLGVNPAPAASATSASNGAEGTSQPGSGQTG